MLTWLKSGSDQRTLNLRTNGERESMARHLFDHQGVTQPEEFNLQLLIKADALEFALLHLLAETALAIVDRKDLKLVARIEAVRKANERTSKRRSSVVASLLPTPGYSMNQVLQRDLEVFERAWDALEAETNGLLRQSIECAQGNPAPLSEFAQEALAHYTPLDDLKAILIEGGLAEESLIVSKNGA
jgi:hypothetical protein